ncbi:DUF6233 domain-containing protein [Streptomyces netropsis]|uniref:Uncharacterized protein n=1 Tax=Streptomyces netropsis TaxID=55404 RepID=A0A7W7L8D9_STRNE|nr:DUF6233 domain-containing protein [Streptomyces netropsis]MBB4885555.1 hypothetical protein [Streptomyces netropsis]GGR38993.1 hypothetical protein GCM10010219_50220 [Streptomyces netropsis]
MNGRAGAGDGQVPERTPTPQIWVRTYDGQEIIGRLLRRWQAPDGQWFYEVSLTLWAHANVHGQDVAEPADITFSVPATHVAPVPDTSYEGVPVRRHPAAIARSRSGRKPTTPPPAEPGTGPGKSGDADWPQVRGDGTDRWKIDHPRYAYTQTGPRRTIVHHSSCFTASRGPAELTTAQAVEALRQPGAVACGVCGADRLGGRPRPR